jgi:hypothetical protein
MNPATTWAVKPKRAPRRRLSFTSPKMTLLLLPSTTRILRSSALETKP